MDKLNVKAGSSYGLEPHQFLIGEIANMAEDHKDMKVVQVGLDEIKVKVEGKTVTLKVA